MRHHPPYLVSHFDAVVLVVPVTVLARSAAPDTVLLTAGLNSPREVQTKMKSIKMLNDQFRLHTCRSRSLNCASSPFFVWFGACTLLPPFTPDFPEASIG